MEIQSEHPDKFTERARKVLSLALEEARSQNHRQVGTEHILLGLIAEGQNVASTVLENLGIQIAVLQEAVISLQAQQSREDTVTKTENLTQGARQSVLSAAEEAQYLHHHYVGTEHLLLGLLHQPDSLASIALNAQNIDLEKVRTMTIQVLSRSSREGDRSSTHQQIGIDQEAPLTPPNQDRFDRFTDRARKVFSLAQEEAQRFQHNYMGTEHLLLGLVKEGEGIAARILATMRVDLKTVRTSVEFIIGRGDRIVLGEIGLTPRAKKVIELAVDEARRLNHQYIGTEHILLGLIREGEGIALGVLESLGVKLENLRMLVLKTLDTPEALEVNVPPEKERHVFQKMQEIHHISQQVYQAVNFADAEQKRLQAPIFGTEYLLLGLLHDEQSMSAQVLKEQGIELTVIYPEIKALRENEERSYPWSQEITALMRAMEDLAGHEAMRLKSDLIGVEHLLLALLRYPEANAIKILQQLGADPEEIRKKVLERIQAG